MKNDESLEALTHTHTHTHTGRYLKEKIYLLKNKHPHIKTILTLCIAFIIGILIFISIYGTAILNPTYTDWLMTGGDLSQHYLGWCFYRTSDWTFPLGLFNNLSYPASISIIYTDSIPLFALFFKAISSLLPENFQYFGFWSMLCFALQCMIGTLLVKKYTKRSFNAILGGIIITITPVMIYRMHGHAALAGQWILLLALVPIVYYDKFSNKKRSIPFWIMIGILASLIHLYFVPLCAMALLAYMIKDFIKRRKIDTILNIIAFGIFSVFTIFVLGGFSSNVEYSIAGFGIFNVNLNTLYNGWGISRIIGYLDIYTSTQYEGMGYLGFGTIILAIIAVINIIRIFIKDKENRKGNIIGAIPYILIFICSIVLAVIPNITFNDKLILSINFPKFIKEIMGMFRANGRFIWYAVYIIEILSLIVITKKCNKNVVTAILLICILVNIYDMSNWFTEKYENYSVEKEYESQLTDEETELLSNAGFENVYVSSSGINKTEKLYSITLWAYDNELMLNNFYFARNIEGTKERLIEALENPKEIDIFFFVSEEDYENYLEYNNCENTYYFTNYIVCTNKELNYT